MNLSREQESIFRKSLLQSINDNGISLPENWETDKVYKSVYSKYELRGCRDLRFFVSQNEQDGFFLDYFFITDDFSSHMRIYQKGSIIKLENFEGQFGWPVLETNREHQRISLHNQNTLTIDVTQDPYFWQDGVAPQCAVKNIESLPPNKGGRVYIPKVSGTPKGFIESHSIDNYIWIFTEITDPQAKGYVKKR